MVRPSLCYVSQRTIHVLRPKHSIEIRDKA
jgi:hypothetical protein